MAGWNNTAELLVGGSGQVYAGQESGAAMTVGNLPTDLTTSLNAALKGLGFLTEDGVSLTVTPNVQDFNVWQSRQPGRRETLATEINNSFSMAQWNEQSVPFAFGGGAVTYSAPAYTYNFPDDDDALAEWSLVVDVVDGSKNFRFVWKRGNVTEPVSAQFNRSNLAALSIGFKALAPSGGGSPGYFITDAARFATGS